MVQHCGTVMMAYWARVQHGYPTIQPPLPNAKPNTPQEWVLAPQHHRQRFSGPVADTPLVLVPERLRKPHPTLLAIRAELREAIKDEYGRVRSSYQLIHVTEASVSRSLRLLTGLFRTLEERGHSISAGESGIRICVEGEEFRISLYEPTKRIPHPNPSQYGYPKWAYEPSGRVTLRLSAPGFYRLDRQWSDTAKKTLEERLGEAVATIESLPVRISAERETRHVAEMRRARAALVRRRQHDRIRLMHQRAKSVDKLIQDLERARQIRALIKDINSTNQTSASTSRLGRWATLYADHLDPLIGFRVKELDAEPDVPSWLDF